jgi:hypothetical protein
MTQKRTTENDLVVSGSGAAATRRKASRARSKHSATPVEEPVISASAEPAPTLSETTLSVTTVEPSVTIVEPAYEAIARLAYSYWEDRGFQGGSAEEDWLRAEMEIRRPLTVTA